MKKAIILILSLIYTILLTACGNTATTGNIESTSATVSETISYHSNSELAQLEPHPSSDYVIKNDSDDRFTIEIPNSSQNDFSDFIDNCIKQGFSVDQVRTNSSYRAFNSDGYRIELSYYKESITSTVYEQIKLGKLRWPTGKKGEIVPKPNSSKGKTDYEDEYGFLIYVGDYDEDSFYDYAEECVKSGFNQDYSISDRLYYGDNSEGFMLSVEYIGFNIIQIELIVPFDYSDDDDNESKVSEATQSKSTSSNTKPANDDDSKLDDNTISPSIKKAIDSYETFIDKYCEFMRNYDKTDISQLDKYLELLEEEVKMTEEFSKLEDKELTDAELDYYIEVELRCLKKLSEVTK